MSEEVVVDRRPSPLFDPAPTARADLTAGALYAISGEGGYIYYGQITPERWVGLFRHRSREPADPHIILAAPVIAVVAVMWPSVGRALRGGRWKKIGRFAVAEQLISPRAIVQWSVGTLSVTVNKPGEPEYDTPVHDPAIQHLERMAAWDAEYHLPERLTAEYGAEPAAWHVGGPIWRERRVAEERARRSPDRPEHRLLPGWVATDPA